MPSRREALAALGLVATPVGLVGTVRAFGGPIYRVTGVSDSELVESVEVVHGSVLGTKMTLEIRLRPVDSYPETVRAVPPGSDAWTARRIGVGVASMRVATAEEPGRHELLFTDNRDVVERVPVDTAPRREEE